MTRTEEWVDEMLMHFQGIKAEHREFIRILSLPNCNTCGRKDCEHKPKLGETVRINCYAYVEADTSQTEREGE